MALVSNRVIIPVLAFVFLMSFSWHKNVFQNSLKNLVGNCVNTAMEKNDSVPHKAEATAEPEPEPRKDLQSEIDAVFEKIQKIIPNITFTNYSMSSSAQNSKVSIFNKRERYCIGEDFVVQVDMYDHMKNRKTYGGDLIRPRLFSTDLGAAVAGRVEDLHNGSYHIHFPLYWAGKVKASIFLWHPSEGVAALWRSRHSSLGVLGYQGRYEYLGKEAFSMCGFQPNTAEEFCEYKDKFYEEAFYCVKPKDLPCECLHNMRALDLRSSYLTPGEKPLIDGSNIGVEMAASLETVNVTDCKTHSQLPDSKCKMGMSSPQPSGYYYKHSWRPAYCGMTTYKTGDDYIKCLQGKRLFLIGDSTLRQFIMYFTEGIKIANYFQFHGRGWDSWEQSLEALNMDKDIYVSYKRHGFPLESFGFYYVKEDLYTSRQIDHHGGGKNTIIVITMGQHFRQFPLKLYIKRAVNIRRAVERLMLRSPDTKVIIKTENTRERGAPQERIGDFHGYCQYLVLKEVFQGVNVGFVDAWDMTVASAAESVHPSGFVFESILSMTFTFAC